MAAQQDRLKRLANELREREEMSRGIDVAKSRQQHMLPPAPEINGFEFATVYHPCSAVSGDFFDFFTTKDGNIGVVLGDVSGHGVEAGMVMGMAKMTVNIYGRIEDDPVKVLCLANRDLHAVLDGRTFVSLSYAVINPNNRHMRFARAGHNPPFLYNPAWKEKSVEQLSPPGLALGVASAKQFDRVLKEQELTLNTGDLFVQYTDGIVEAPNDNKEQFGEERLEQLVKKYSQTSPRELITLIDQALNDHTRGLEPEDDITMVILRLTRKVPNTSIFLRSFDE